MTTAIRGFATAALLTAATATAAAADALRAHLGYERIAVLGHSWGGCLALKYALRYPERLTHLLLVGTTAAWDYMDQLAADLQRRAPSTRLLASGAATILSSRNRRRFATPSGIGSRARRERGDEPGRCTGRRQASG